MKKVVFLVAAILLCVAPSMAQNIELKTTNFQDGTGSIGLAPGWKVDGVYNGAVQCVGPNGAAIVLKMPWVVQVPGSLTGLPGTGTEPVAPIGNISAALNQILAKKVGATLKNLRGRRIGNQSYLLNYDYTQNGKSYSAIGFFAPLSYRGGQPFWQLYSSAVVAPTEVFPKMLPTMLAIWKSWHPSGAKPIEGSASQIFDKIMEEKKLSQEKIHQQFRDEILRDH